MKMRSSIEALVSSMQILSQEVKSDDGIANAAIAEAARELYDMHIKITEMTIALKLFVAAEKGNGWSELSSDSSERQAICAARRALKINGAGS